MIDNSTEGIRKNENKEKTLVNNLNQQLREKYHYADIVGKSTSMRKVYSLIDAVKGTDSTVLLSGETGTGKEVIANTIHYNSFRRNGPFVTVNCGAIPKNLLEREFFGHVKGAYTGAYQNGT